MTQDGVLLYIQQDELQVVRVPYGETERLGTDIFLPDEDLALDGLREVLDVNRWHETVSALHDTRVQVTLPWFELEYSTDNRLDRVLKDLGMEIAYEAGTEVAAVSGAAMDESDPPDFRVDRPFLFTISGAETGIILQFLREFDDLRSHRHGCLLTPSRTRMITAVARFDKGARPG